MKEIREYVEKGEASVGQCGVGSRWNSVDRTYRVMSANVGLRDRIQ